MLLYSCVRSAPRARCAPAESAERKGKNTMLNTIAQRESLALAIAASARMDSYVDDDEAKAHNRVIETVKAASCGLVDHMYEPDEASKVAANGAATGANGTATGEASNKDRDSHGRFAKGNRAGVGNPFARQVAAFRAAILQATTHEDIRLITKKLIHIAREGNLAAAKLLLAYTCGKADEASDPDRLDLEEWNLFREAKPIPQEFHKLTRHANTDQQLQMARILREMSTDRMAEEYQVLHIKDLAQCSRKEARKRAAQLAANQAMAQAAAAKASPPCANGNGHARESIPAAAATVNNGAVGTGKHGAPAGSKSAENGDVSALLATRGRAS